MTPTLCTFVRDEQGQDLVDYMLLLAFACFGTSVLFINIDVCPVDRTVLYCVVRYEPEMLLLLGLVLVCAVLAVRPVKI